MKLKAAREAIASDLGGKYQAIDVDSTALGINEQSSGLRKRFWRLTSLSNLLRLICNVVLKKVETSRQFKKCLGSAPFSAIRALMYRKTTLYQLVNDNGGSKCLRMILSMFHLFVYCRKYLYHQNRNFKHQNASSWDSPDVNPEM